MRAKITKWLVETMPPRARDSFIWDSDLTGFGVKITPTGRRVFILQYRFSGRLRRHTIGRLGEPWSEMSARLEAKRLLRDVAEGSDPAERGEGAIGDVTVAELCDLYLAKGCGHKKPSTLATDRGRIERHIKPLLGGKPARRLSYADVQQFRDDVAGGKTAADVRTKPRGRAIVRGGRGTAVRTVALLGAIFSFAIARGLRYDNPAHGARSR